MATLRFGLLFGGQFARILNKSERRWNYRNRMYALIRRAAFDLAANPDHRQAHRRRIGDSTVILYHTKWSAASVSEDIGRILDSPFVLVAEHQDGDILRVLAVWRESAITQRKLRTALRAARRE